jgi:hypothetical protein
VAAAICYKYGNFGCSHRHHNYDELGNASKLAVLRVSNAVIWFLIIIVYSRL